MDVAFSVGIPPKSTLRLIRAGRRRELMRLLVLGIGRGASVASAGALAWVGGAKALGGRLAWIPAPSIPGLAGLIGVGVIVGVAWAWMRRWSMEKGAHELDRRLGLHDRLGTALALCGSADPFDVVAVSEAEKVAGSTDCRGAVRVRAGWEWWAWPLAAAASVAVLLWVPGVQWKAGGTPSVPSVGVSAATGAVRDAKREIAEGARSPDDPLVTRQMKEVAAIEQELNQGLTTASQAMTRAASVLDRGADERVKEAERTREAAEATRRRLADAAATSKSEGPLSEALRAGDVERAAAAARELAARAPEMSPEDRAKYAEQLRELAGSMEKSSTRSEDADVNEPGVRRGTPGGAGAEPAAKPDGTTSEKQDEIHDLLKQAAEELEHPAPEPKPAQPNASPAPTKDQHRGQAEPGGGVKGEQKPRAGDESKPASPPDRAQGREVEPAQEGQQAQRSDGAKQENSQARPAGEKSPSQRQDGPKPSQSQPTPGGEQKPEAKPGETPNDRQDGERPPGQQTQGEKESAGNAGEKSEKPISREGLPGDQPKPSPGTTPAPNGQPTGAQQNQPPGQAQPAQAKPDEKPGTESARGREGTPGQGERGEPRPGGQSGAGGERREDVPVQKQQETPGEKKPGASQMPGANEKGRPSPQGMPQKQPGAGDKPGELPGTLPKPGELSPDAVKRLAQALKELADKPGEADRLAQSAEQMREQAQKMLRDASPEERQQIEQLARTLAKEMKDRGERHGEMPPGLGGTPPDGAGDGREAGNGPGAGRGPRPVRESPEARPVPVDARKGVESGDRVISEVFGPGSRGVGEGAGAGGVLREAARGAENAIEQQGVPREYADLVRRVFRKYLERTDAPAGGGRTP